MFIFLLLTKKETFVTLSAWLTSEAYMSEGELHVDASETNIFTVGTASESVWHIPECIFMISECLLRKHHDGAGVDRQG